MRSWITIVLVTGLVSSPATAGDLTLTNVSATFGIIQSLESDGTDYSNVFYPELQVQGDFLTRGLGWETFWGYWDDGFTKPGIVDAIVYSSTGHMVGLRMSVDLSQFEPHLPLPVVFWGGLAHHFIALEDLGSEDYTGARGIDQTTSANSWEIGARINLGLTEQVSLRFDARQLFYMSEVVPGLAQAERLNFGLGFGIMF